MSQRLRDEEYAAHAARHSLHPKPGVDRLDRIEPLKKYGVSDETSLAQHALKIMSASDTVCYRGAYGEHYGNDRLNTIVRINEADPTQSTVHHNDQIRKPEAERLSASDRIRQFAQREQDVYGVECVVREGGSSALEEDRLKRPIEQISSGKPDPEPPNPPTAAMPPPPKEPDKWDAFAASKRIPDRTPPSQEDGLDKSKRFEL